MFFDTFLTVHRILLKFRNTAYRYKKQTFNQIIYIHIITIIIKKKEDHMMMRGRRGRDRMVVRFTTTYEIKGYHHWCCEFESRSGRAV
jgi:hypothetical protein